MGVPSPVHPEVSPDVDPLKWSEDEAFLRMGLFSGVSNAETYRPSDLGGNHIQRRIPRYMADKKTEERSCVKHKTASSSHTPGVHVPYRILEMPFSIFVNIWNTERESMFYRCHRDVVFEVQHVCRVWDDAGVRVCEDSF